MAGMGALQVSTTWPGPHFPRRGGTLPWGSSCIPLSLVLATHSLLTIPLPAMRSCGEGHFALTLSLELGSSCFIAHTVPPERQHFERSTSAPAAPDASCPDAPLPTLREQWDAGELSAQAPEPQSAKLSSSLSSPRRTPSFPALTSPVDTNTQLEPTTLLPRPWQRWK